MFNNWKIIKFDKLDSTMIKAKELVFKSNEKRIVVLADTQTAGYGRNKRPWYSPLGGLWFTIVLKDIDMIQYTQLPLIVPITIVEPLKDYGLNAMIKWPNDILVFNKKIAGILIEGNINQSNKIKYALIGIGINVNNTYKDIPNENVRDNVISIRDIIGRHIDKEELLCQILQKMDKYLEFAKNPVLVEEIYKIYKKYSMIINKRVRVLLKNKEYSGIAVDITKNGFLLLKVNDKITIEIADAHVMEII
ncbi:MAG: biotin--[acetyl-CoA-carboxylase] ligase [Candidatus Asgardarchaeum californiense]|nr:MAG: biotin--[acetyl-CoA-carboxylase] ligase [Candidatus Asgardarchaeum californiense]